MITAVLRQQNDPEEIANAASHALGALLAAVFAPQLIGNALQSSSIHGIAAAVYAGSMILLFSISAVYHWMPAGATKELLRRLDHAAIFLFIAGSYTPFMVGPVAEDGGYWVLAVIWAAATLGTIAKCANRLTHPFLSTGLYLGLGWLAVVVLEPLISNTPREGVMLIVAGGVLYTLGAIVFHFDEKVRWAHLAWHVLVLGASACHFVAVLRYVVA